MLYRHGLRTKEAIELTWDDVLFDQSRLNVRRAKNGQRLFSQSSAMNCANCVRLRNQRRPMDL
jgi:integrase